METLELIERISNGEDSFTQFKRESIPAKDLAKEFVSFLNAELNFFYLLKSYYKIDKYMFSLYHPFPQSWNFSVFRPFSNLVDIRDGRPKKYTLNLVHR